MSPRESSFRGVGAAARSSRAALRLALWSSFAGAFIQQSDAFRLYPEQDGKFNWHVEHVGMYTGVTLCDSAGAASAPSFAVATDDGVVAVIQADDGSLVWRQVLEEGAHVDGSKVTCDDGTVRLGGTDVFDAVDGRWVGATADQNGDDDIPSRGKSRVCVDGDNAACVDVLVATGARPVTGQELASYALVKSPRKPRTAVAFPDVAVVQFACGTTVGFDRSTQVPIWTRYEYLSSIDHAFFTDLPPSTPALEEAWAKTQPSASRSLFVQLLILKTQVGAGTPRDVATIESHKAMTSDLLRPTRDMEGFRQQIVVSSARAGKVASLHSGDGRVLWEVDAGVDAGVLGKLVVVPWSVSDRESVLAVFVSGPETTRVLLVDGFTGRVLKEEHVAGGAGVSVVPAGSYERGSTTGSTTVQQAFAVLNGNADGKVVAMLPKDAAGEAHAHLLDSLVLWKVSEDRTSVYGVKPNAGEVWRFNAASSSSSSSSSSRILEVVARDADEAMYSVAKPVFGGGVLIKSVNPNALLVVAGDSDSDTHRETLEVSVIDAVTGRVIVSHEVQYARGPVKGIVSENWVAYHYWDTVNARWTMGVIDMYHPQPEDLTVASLLMGTHGGASDDRNDPDTMSPYGPPATLLVDSETFRVKYPASCLAVTKTAHGTAAKMLLLGTPDGQIAAIDRRMLDPRRPKVAPGAKPTPEQAFERLPVYSPEVSVTGPSFVTLHHQVERLREVTTTAAVLESSTLVFANGLDTYFMRMMPSRGFDTVPPDFPRALLVTMVLGLGIALVTLRRVVRSRTLTLQWR